MTKNTTVKIISVVGVVLSFILSLIYLHIHNYEVSLLSFIMIFYFLFIIVIERITKHKVLYSIKISYHILGIAGIVFGHIIGFYDRVYLYDKIIHLSSGILISWIGYETYYLLNNNNKTTLYLFIFSFNTSLAAIWELIEFTLDSVFAMTLQKGMHDTMFDMLSAIIGGLIFIYFIKRHKSHQK